jgi:hypothetical protein
MAKKRLSRYSTRSPQGVSVERSRGGRGWTLVHPACVRETAEDLEEVRGMIAAGETEIAADELRWLLETCTDHIEVHYLLGKLAVEATGDVPLGRAHFGAGYQLGTQALKRAGAPAPLSALHPANRSFYDAGRGLAWCLAELGKGDLALEVVEQLLRLDPTDPLELHIWIDELRAPEAPLIHLTGLFKPPSD